MRNLNDFYFSNFFKNQVIYFYQILPSSYCKYVHNSTCASMYNVFNTLTYSLRVSPILVKYNLFTECQIQYVYKIDPYKYDTLYVNRFMNLGKIYEYSQA